MNRPIFLSLSQILEIHRIQIDEFGGTDELRDIGLINSAIAMPMQSFRDTFLHNDLYEMAAAYLFHIVKNHAFVDGNKRVALAAALIFLDLNSIEITATDDELEKLVLDTIADKIKKENIADFFRTNSQ